MQRLTTLFLALLLAGCASSSGTKIQSKDTDSGDVVTTYDDSTTGIRLTYPGNWQEQSIPFMMRPKGTIIVLVAPSDQEGMKMPPTLSIVARDVQANENLDAMQQQLIDRARANISDFKLISASVTHVGADPARQVIYTGSKIAVNFEVMNVITVHTGRQFGFAYSADPEIFNSHLPDVQKVIESVQFAK